MKKVVAPFLRSPYNYDMNEAGDESGLKCLDRSLTKQADAADADINTLVERFKLTGELPKGIRMPSYGDFDTVNDFQTAMNAIRQANESFMAMPAATRARFHNDPQEFVAFCADTNNLEEARKLGLVPAQELARAAQLTETPLTPAPGAEAPPAASGGSAAKGKKD